MHLICRSYLVCGLIQLQATSSLAQRTSYVLAQSRLLAASHLLCKDEPWINSLPVLRQLVATARDHASVMQSLLHNSGIGRLKTQTCCGSSLQARKEQDTTQHAPDFMSFMHFSRIMAVHRRACDELILPAQPMIIGACDGLCQWAVLWAPPPNLYSP